jgi:hypothetical protein
VLRLSAVRILPKLVAVCAIVALVVTCTAGDPFGGPDDPDDEATIAFHLSHVVPPLLPPARLEVDLILAVAVLGRVEDQPVHGRSAELDIFRPPRTGA